MKTFLAGVSAAALLLTGCVSVEVTETADQAPRRPVQNAAAGPARAPASAMASRSETSRHQLAQGAGYRALHLCTGLFESEMSEEMVYATLSRSSRATETANEVIDRENHTVAVSYLDDMPPRIAVWRENLGCTQLPIGATMDAVQHLTPWPADIERPNFDDQPWPMGDQSAIRELRPPVQDQLSAVIDEAFRDQEGEYEGDTWGIVIVQGGQIIAERYERGYDMHVSARTNSMCKSLSVSLVGIGVRDGLVDIHAPAPLEAWRTPGDPRGAITLADMLGMNSGFWTSGAGNPQIDIYGSGAPPSEISALNMMDAEPGTQFVYSGSDTILSTRAVREALNDDASFISLPHRELLWRIGMTRTVIETDWRDDFLISGQCWSTARDFARFGLLYLNDGVWNGERILPEGWSDYVSSPASAQPPSVAAGRPGYGAQFWLYGEAQGMASPGYAAAGALGQYAMIVPERDLVVVRRGLDVGDGFDIASFTADVMAVLEE